MGGGNDTPKEVLDKEAEVIRATDEQKPYYKMANQGDNVANRGGFTVPEPNFQEGNVIDEVLEVAKESALAQELIAQECDAVKEMLLAKNLKYGNSAIEPCRFFSNADPIEQINVRLDDKLSRLLSGRLDEDEDVELDIMGYLVLKRIARIWKEKGGE